MEPLEQMSLIYCWPELCEIQKTAGAHEIRTIQLEQKLKSPTSKEKIKITKVWLSLNKTCQDVPVICALTGFLPNKELKKPKLTGVHHGRL